MSSRPLGAQISAMLKDRGVDVIFGIPGVHNIEMYRGIEESGIQHVLARHEQGAGFMADGYARATGRPGVAYVITGPGLCNIMTPMGQAYSDSVPMLVISSCLDETVAARGQLHQMKDQAGAARTVCDWSEEARTADAAYALIDRAITEMHAARPRPKHVQIAIQLATGPAPGFPPPSQIRPTPASNIGPETVIVRDLISSSTRPLFIFGGGAREMLDSAASLLNATGAACFTTYAGRGLVTADHPMNFGAYLGRPDSAKIIASADLVMAVGTELSETDLWRDELGHSGTLVRIDIDPEVLSDRHRADIQVLSDAGLFLHELKLDEDWETPKTTWAAAEVIEARTRWRAEADAERPGIVPICDALRAVLPEDTMIFSDMTQFAYVAKEVWDMSAPGLWHHPTGFGTLGYALPAAIGGKVGVGDQPVVAIAGDYGFQYTLQELGTAVELGLSLPILLWDNEALKEIADSMAASQIAPFAVHAKNPDFGKLAAAYGVNYARPGSIAALRRDVTTALLADGPTIIHMTPTLSAAK